MPTPHFVPTSYAEQQQKTTPYGAPPPTASAFPSMPALPNTGMAQFPSAFPAVPLPNAGASSPFNAGSAPPLPPTAGQASSFIGQQPQQMPTPGPPSQQGGFYGQQQALMQQRPGLPAFNNTNNPYGQQPTSTPPSSSSPATITPSYVQPNQMPGPPPSAMQQPYGGYTTQPNYYNPAQPYPKAP